MATPIMAKRSILAGDSRSCCHAQNRSIQTAPRPEASESRQTVLTGRVRAGWQRSDKSTVGEKEPELSIYKNGAELYLPIPRPARYVCRENYLLPDCRIRGNWPPEAGRSIRIHNARTRDLMPSAHSIESASSCEYSILLPGYRLSCSLESMEAGHGV